MVGQGYLAGQSIFIGSKYLPFSDGGTTPYKNHYEFETDLNTSV